MVRAILAGTKTQTRRLVVDRIKRKREPSGPEMLTNVFRDDPKSRIRVNEGGAVAVDTHGGVFAPLLFSPYGVPGDRLRVRETWRVSDASEADIAYQADDETLRFISDGDAAFWKRWGAKSERGRWCPSIYLPRWASRITLLVESARVERLQAISEEDARAEGLACLSKDGGVTYKYGIADRDGLPGNDDDGWHWHEWEADPCAAYRKLWDSINGKRAPWASNPWVWVVTFKRVEER